MKTKTQVYADFEITRHYLDKEGTERRKGGRNLKMDQSRHDARDVKGLITGRSVLAEHQEKLLISQLF